MKICIYIIVVRHGDMVLCLISTCAFWEQSEAPSNIYRLDFIQTCLAPEERLLLNVVQCW